MSKHKVKSDSKFDKVTVSDISLRANSNKIISNK